MRLLLTVFIFFFSSRRRHTRSLCDWSSDVCSSDLRMGFIGSLPPSQHPDLLALPATRYPAVDTHRYPGLTCVDTRVSALGVTRRAVLTHSPSLHAAQTRGFTQTLAKA